MDLSGKKILIRNEKEGKKVQYLLFLFGYCWFSMRSDRRWKYNNIEHIPAYIYQEDRANDEKLLRYCETYDRIVDGLNEVTIDQLIKHKGLNND